MVQVFVWLVYSPDDNGYYAEVTNKAGQELHSTNVFMDKVLLKRHLLNVANKENWNLNYMKGGV